MLCGPRCRSVASLASIDGCSNKGAGGSERETPTLCENNRRNPTMANLRAETTTNTETSTCKHEDRHSDHFLFPVFGDVFHYQTRLGSSLFAFVSLKAQDVRFGDAGTRNGGFRRQTKPQQSGAGAPVSGGLGRCRFVRILERMRARFAGHGRGCCSWCAKTFCARGSTSSAC